MCLDFEKELEEAIENTKQIEKIDINKPINIIFNCMSNYYLKKDLDAIKNGRSLSDSFEFHDFYLENDVFRKPYYYDGLTDCMLFDKQLLMRKVIDSLQYTTPLTYLNEIKNHSFVH